MSRYLLSLTHSNVRSHTNHINTSSHYLFNIFNISSYLCDISKNLVLAIMIVPAYLSTDLILKGMFFPYAMTVSILTVSSVHFYEFNIPVAILLDLLKNIAYYLNIVISGKFIKRSSEYLISSIKVFPILIFLNLVIFLI